MTGDRVKTVARILATARSQGRKVLLETEGFALLRALGIQVPAHLLVRDADEASAALEELPGNRLVVKVAGPEIVHKSDVGGVAVVAKTPTAVVEAIRGMMERLGDRTVGYVLCEFVDYPAVLGGEILVGMRRTEDFGPIVTLGPGGIHTEFLARNFKTGRELAILSPALASTDRIGSALAANAITPLATGGLRGQQGWIGLSDLRELVGKLLQFAASAISEEILELEINPLALAARGPVALDVLVRLREPAAVGAAAPARPLGKLKNLLEPRSLGIIGVSERLNPGRIILDNTLREGFDPARIWVVKPGRDEIAGCPCFPDVASLPERADTIILAIDAAQVPGTVEEILAERKAESLIVIPGGLGERRGSEGLAARLDRALRAARASDWQGPVVNGANCLGIRSKPGRYDTLFIPEYKLPATRDEVSPLALISQSGAFAVARASKLARLNPRYLISIGNQIDLTVGDYLRYLRDDPEVGIFACYVEGFRPLDGLRWLEAAAEITATGKTVVLYRAGRTPAGVRATASHTASIAGDYAVTRELAAQAGVVLAESLADFDDLVRLFCCLRGKRVDGWRLGGMSNAGFECVAIADSLGAFRLPALGDRTTERLAELLRRFRLEGIVEARNPVDVTPIMDGEGFAEAARLVLEDPGVDVGIIGCVPLTGALATLAAGAGHAEDLEDEGSIARRLVRIRDAVAKAWIAVVDAGALYDPLAAMLEAAGVPTFRTADRALRLFEVFCRDRLRSRTSEIDGASVSAEEPSYEKLSNPKSTFPPGGAR